LLGYSQLYKEVSGDQVSVNGESSSHR